MIYLVIVGPLLAFKENPLTTSIVFISLFVIFLTLWIIARVTFKSFKVDLIQALFLDNNIAVTVKPKKYITKEHFNSTNIFDKALMLSGEDCIEGSTGDFHFIFSELKAQGKLTWIGFENLFEGLYFYGTWDKPPVLSNFRIKQRGLLDTFGVNSITKFERYFEVLDPDGNTISDSSSIDSIPYSFKNELIDLIKKHNCRIELIYQYGQVLVLLHGHRDYFPLDFEDKIEDRQVFKTIAKDVLFMKDLIHLLDNHFK